MPLPLAAELGTIRSADGWSYRITPNDLLWLGRSVEYEGGTDPVATAWTYAQRLAARGRSMTLADLVRAHSQPVSLAWDEASDPFCVAHPERCTPDALARRAEAASASWDSLSVGPMLARWAKAEVGNTVPRATDFADATVSSHFLSRYPQARVVKRAGNWYIAEGLDSSPRASVNWPSSFVRIEHRGRVSTVSASSGGIGVLGFTVIALVAWRAVASVEYLGKQGRR